MKESFCRFIRSAHFAPIFKYNVLLRWLPLFMLLGVDLSAWGQAPGLAWTNNIGATLFALDTQGNVYTYVNGAVEVLNPAGTLIQSNNICAVPGTARRDASGDYYFAGTFEGTQNFGGVTLVDAWLTVPLGYLAKYTSAGTLLWAVSLGQTNYANTVDDLAINPDGSLTIGYHYSGGSELALFSAAGANLWQTNIFSGPNSTAALKVSSLAGSQGAYLLYKVDDSISGGFYDSTGHLTTFTPNPFPALLWSNYLSWNGRPVPGSNNDAYVAVDSLSGIAGGLTPMLNDYQAGGTLLSSQSIGPVAQWVLTGDGNGKLYLAGLDGAFSEYLANGALVWTTNYGPPVSVMLLDSTGGRYISRIDGSIAKLLPETVAMPVITNSPQGATIFAGSDVTFNVGASGYAPLNYHWLYQSNALAPVTPIATATNATLTLSNAIGSQSGLYSVLISNVAGSATSTPVTLRVKSVELFFGSQMLTDGSYYFATGIPPTLAVQSAFANGEIYYTLDGSTPSFLSTPYTGPFVLSNSATVNAIGYSSDFSLSELADTLIATIAPQYTLSVSTAGGGTIDLFPLGGDFTNTNITYSSNVMVTATANPAAGFCFLYWQGVSSSTNSTIKLAVNQNLSLTAVFGTTLSTTVAGNGQVMLAPPGGLYPYGTVARLEALPQPGNFFGAWGNAASGSVNPLYFSVTNPNPTVSSVFGPTPAGDSALTVLTLGQGHVGQSPAGNVFATNVSVTLTAIPNSGQSFRGWSGSVASTQNPLTVAMTQSQVITAHFTGQSVTLGMGGATGLTPQGFQFTVSGEPQSVYQIFSSSNMLSWQLAGLVTNATGVLQLTYPAATNSPATFYRAVLTQ